MKSRTMEYESFKPFLKREALKSFRTHIIMINQEYSTMITNQYGPHYTYVHDLPTISVSQNRKGVTRAL